MTGRKTAVKRKPSRSPGGGRAKVPAPFAPVAGAEARWRSEERYRSVVNVMTEGMVLQTAEGTIIDCNEQAVRILGQTRNQILGRTSQDPHWRAVREDGSPFPGEEHPAMITLKTGQPCRQVVMGLQLPKGILRWISINAEPLFWNNKIKPAAVVVTFSDITERKRVESLLQESNELLSLFMQHSPIFAYIKEITPDASRVLFASDNFREMVGIPGSAMQGKTMAELFPAEFAAKITRDDQAVLASGEVLKVDEELNGRHYATVKFPIVRGGRSLLAGYTIDITDRKQAEVQREQFYQLFNISTDLMVFADPQGCFQRVNPATLRLLGYTEAELLEKPFLSFVHPDDRRSTNDEMTRQMQTGSTMNFINRYRCKDGSVRWLSWRANYVVAEGITYATARDITEQRQAEQELKGLEASYHDLYEHAPDMYVSTDSATGSVIRCNQTFLNATGYTRDEIIGQPVFALYQPESQPVARQAFEQFIATGSLRNLELILKRKDGSALPISLNASAVRDPQGRILHSRSTLHDITERKQAEAALRQSEERFRAIADFSPDIISIFDREGRLVFNSAAAFKIHGYRADELENRSTFDFIHPEDGPGVTAAFSRLLEGQAEEVKVQYRYRNVDGSYKWMEAIGRNELTNPHINGIIAISRDITERKLAEKKLRKSQQFIMETGRIGKVGGWEFEIQTGKQTWTEAVYDIHEVDTSYEPTVEKGIKFYTPASRPVIEQAVKEAIEQGKAFDVELDIITAKGNLRWVQAIGKRDSERCRIFGFFQDITERKQAELKLRQLNETLEQRVAERTAALQEGEERFRAIATNTPDHLLIQDLELCYQLVINPQLGLSEAEMIGKTDQDLFKPADAARLTALKKRVLKTGKPVRLETPFPNMKGELEYFEGIYTPKRNVTGKVDGLIGYFRNVTERKRSEETLKESEAKFSVAFKNSPTPMNISRVDNGLIVDANDAFIAATGYSYNEVINSNIKALGIWANPKIRAQIVKQLMDQGKVTDKEFQYRKKNGEVGTGIYSAHRIHLKNVPHILSAVKDITERKRAEGALLESERLHRLLFTNLQDALVTVESPTWKIVIANPAAVKMFRARNVEQLLAAKPWELSPEFQPDGQSSLQAARVVINKAMQQGTHSFEWRHRRLKGEEFPASVLLSRVEVAGRTLVQGTVRDLTERVRLEQEVLNISDWERRHIAQDLHDGLGQLLVGAGYLADSLRQDMTAKSEPWVPRLNRIQAAINAAGKQARDVARGVQPVEPEPNGLMTALAKLAQQTSELFHVRCDFKCHPPVNIEDCQTGTHLFRIAQESVTNAIKHGKAKRISLHLTQTPKQITLAIKDDGVGLTSSRQKKDGMGLRIMNYRAGIIGGTLTINNKSVIGTTVTCRVPVSDGKHRPAKGGKD